VAITVLTDAHIIINGVTLSSKAKSVTTEDSREAVDITAFGATSKTVAKGLGDAKMTVEFYQDMAAAQVHATLQPLISSTTPVTVEARQTSAVRSATNPAYVLSALLMEYNMLDGAVGEASTISAEFINGSQTGVQYLIA
jgi:DNA-binding CsgD family transcriptional regulator